MYAEVEQIIFNKGKPRAAITLPFTAVWGKLIATKLLLKVFFFDFNRGIYKNYAWSPAYTIWVNKWVLIDVCG